MDEVIFFLPPIQVGYEIYYANLEIDGIQTRQDAVWEFIQGSKQSLEWEQEPSNPHDPFAIKIFGISEHVFTTKHELLGYLTGDVAKEVVNGGLWPFLQLRLDCIYVTKQGFIAIRFQILGPIRKQHKKKAGTSDTSFTDGPTQTPGVPLSTLSVDKQANTHKDKWHYVKRIGLFGLKIVVVLLGIGMSLVGGKIGTAAWQSPQNIYSMMVFAVAFIIGGGWLIWTGIKPSKSTQQHPT